MGGKTKRDPYYWDIWTIKYLPNFKWYNLTEEVKEKKKAAEKKLLTQVSQAKREALAFLENREKAIVEEKIQERKEAKAAKEQKKKKKAGLPQSEEVVPKEIKPKFQVRQERVFQRSEKATALDDSFLKQFMGGATTTPDRNKKRPREE